MAVSNIPVKLLTIICHSLSKIIFSIQSISIISIGNILLSFLIEDLNIQEDQLLLIPKLRNSPLHLVQGLL